MHRVFRDIVTQGRRGKIDPNNEELFSGDFWIGQQAVDNGLADQIGDIYSYCDQHFPGSMGYAKLIKYSPVPSFPFFFQ